MKRLLSVLTLLALFATGMQAQPLEVRARHYRYVVDDMRPGVHKTYDPRRDCMVWRDGRGRFLGEVRNTITVREKRRLDRMHHRPGPPPPRPAYTPGGGVGPREAARRAEMRREMRREAARREMRREMRREDARREMRREMRREEARREMRREMRREEARREMRRDAARREAVRRDMRRDAIRRDNERREMRREMRDERMRRGDYRY